VGHVGPVRCVTVSPSGSHFASGGRDRKVMIRSESGEGGDWARVQVLEDHTSGIRAVSPDGKQLATGNLYSFNEGSAILAHTFEGHTSFVYSLSFSPDCKLLCSGSVDESIKFWNPADGSLVKSIDQAHTSSLYSVSYSPNGRVLVSAGEDNTMKIWDAETFELKHTFEQEFDTNQLTITADSNFIVSANTDHTVRFTSCREFTFVPSCLTPILNLILHIVYKWEFVSFLEPNENTSTHAHTNFDYSASACTTAATTSPPRSCPSCPRSTSQSRSPPLDGNPSNKNLNVKNLTLNSFAWPLIAFSFLFL